ncbi:MAG: hypothetical protein ACJA1P_001872 [Maribacter sp.]|jgi:hypothetical protein|tara:strand:- start:399 stop:629 length:231 start_codon:yes stop_codon:yes gene_type:complete
MKVQHKALLFNFFGFAVLFLITRFGIGYFIDMPRLYLAIGAAVFATLLAPKFAVVREIGNEKLMMKWIFMKSSKEV